MLAACSRKPQPELEGTTVFLRSHASAPPTCHTANPRRLQLPEAAAAALADQTNGPAADLVCLTPARSTIGEGSMVALAIGYSEVAKVGVQSGGAWLVSSILVFF